jgi:hypothetical protein
MKTRNLASVFAIVTGALIMSSTAQAGLIDEFTTASSEYAQVYTHSTGVGVTIEGAGVNRVVKLYVSNYTSGTGSSYWEGVVPNDAVVDNGINSISVNIANTCDYTASATYGSAYCYAVSATFTKSDYLWKTNGVIQYTWDGIIYQIIGGISAFSASVTGTVNDTDISTPRAYLGKYTDVDVTVSTVN